ncbi:MAG TPA: SPASM domain-containing protein [Candidatus Kapabacteria bacterium]|nr:SPASM domain-containing protein [Candidatus Kapabacteria bacterium]
MDKDRYLKEIYRFRRDKNYFGLDVHNALFFKMNKVTWDILNAFPHYDKLTGLYDSTEIEEAVDSLEKNHFITLKPNDLEQKTEPISSAPKPVISMGLCLQDTVRGTSMPNHIIWNSIDLLMQESCENEECRLVFITNEFEKSLSAIEGAIIYARKQEKIYNKKIIFTLNTTQFPISHSCIRFAAVKDLWLEIEITPGHCREDIYNKLREDTARELNHLMAPIFKNVIVTLNVNSENIAFVNNTLANLDRIGFLFVFLDFLCSQCRDRGKIPGNYRQESTADIADIVSPTLKQYLYGLPANNAGNSIKIINIIPFIHAVMTSTKIRSGCRAGLDYIAVSADGDIYPCHKAIANGSFKLGSILAGLNRGQWEQIALHEVENKAACRKCGVRYLCGGGSPLNATGVPPSDCRLAKEMAENAMFRYQLLDLKQKAQVIGIDNRMKNIMPYRWATPGKTTPGGIIRRLTVKGTSMWPFLKENDRVVVRPLERRKIKNGDIICFGKPATCHRVIWKYKKKGRCYVLEKGDHQVKGTFIPLEEVSGKVASVQKEAHSYNLDTKRWAFLGMIIALFSLLVHVSKVVFNISGRRKKTKWRKY